MFFFKLSPLLRPGTHTQTAFMFGDLKDIFQRLMSKLNTFLREVAKARAQGKTTEGSVPTVDSLAVPVGRFSTRNRGYAVSGVCLFRH